MRQRLSRVSLDNEAAAALADDGRGHVIDRNLDRRVRRWACEPGGKQTHSTNVTLLISRSVVRPCMTFSTADSRRKRMPSSCASFFTSEVGPVIGTYTGPGLLGVGAVPRSFLA